MNKNGEKIQVTNHDGTHKDYKMGEGTLKKCLKVFKNRSQKEIIDKIIKYTDESRLNRPRSIVPRIVLY